MSEISIRPMSIEDLRCLEQEYNLLNPELPVSEDVVAALERYVKRAISPGQFLRAVLENDLFEAIGRADSYNRASLFHIVRYIYNNLPGHSFGSPGHVERFLKMRREQMEREIT